MDPYLVTHLARHAAAGGELDDLLHDPRFVATAEPANLTAALAHVGTDDGRRVARACRQVPAAVTDPGRRAAYLALSAQQLGDTALRDTFLGCGLDLPWSALGGAWQPPDEHDVVMWLDDATTAVTLMPAADGAVYVVSGDRSGRLRVHELTGGVTFPAADLAAHRAGVTALAGCERPDGLHLLVSGAADGEVRLWQVDSGLTSAAAPPRPGAHAIAGVAVAWAPAGALVAACDTRGGLWLARFGDDGTAVPVAEARVDGVRHVAVHGRGAGPPLVVAALADHRGLLLRPDGHGGFRAGEVPMGRWSATAVAVDDRSGLVAFGTGGRAVHLVDPSAGSVRTVEDAASSGLSALSLDAAHGGLLLGDRDGAVQFWAFDADGDPVRHRVGRPHQDTVLALSAARGPAGPTAVSCGHDRKVATWDPLAGGAGPDAHERDVDLVAASPGGASVSLLRREGAAGVERWRLDPGHRLTPLARPGPAHDAVTATVDGDGVIRRFRSDLDLRSTGRRRPVPLLPYRGLAVAEIDGALTTLALRRDGVLEAYSGDDLDTPVEKITTGVVEPVSLSLGRMADGEPVIGCGDPDGNVRLNRWSGRADWSRVPAWPLGVADPRTAVAADDGGRSLLLTGDGAGTIALWHLTDAGPRPLGRHTQRAGTPITAVALARGDGGLVAVSGDRGGVLDVCPVTADGLAPRPRHRIMLGSAVLAVAPVAPAEIVVWSRQGALILSWT